MGNIPRRFYVVLLLGPVDIHAIAKHGLTP